MGVRRCCVLLGSYCQRSVGDDDPDPRSIGGLRAAANGDIDSPIQSQVMRTSNTKHREKNGIVRKMDMHHNSDGNTPWKKKRYEDRYAMVGGT